MLSKNWKKNPNHQFDTNNYKKEPHVHLKGKAAILPYT